MSRLYDLFRAHPQVSTDSRRIEPGSLFFALRGASFDGNRFAADALARGAAFAVVDDPSVAATDSRMIRVPEVLAALQALAREHRRALGIPLLALTGSNGKTTTKELVSRVLAERFRVYATRGNLNNHIGVPLTLLAMTADTQFGVVEMGASACGEIALLCGIAEPDYGLITNIGRAHLDGFGGPEGVRRGKGELFDYLAAHGGRAFVPEDDAVLVAMAAERSSLAVSAYSRTLADGMDHRLEGTYNRANIAAAVAVGQYFGIGDERIRRAVASYAPDNHRSQRIETGRNTVVADCYNANPSSMQAAVENFRAEPLGPRREKVMILGDMLELGAWSLAEHARIVRLALEVEGARLLLVGEAFAAACRNHSCGRKAEGSAACNVPLSRSGEDVGQEEAFGTAPTILFRTTDAACTKIVRENALVSDLPGHASRTENPAARPDHSCGGNVAGSAACNVPLSRSAEEFGRKTGAASTLSLRAAGPACAGTFREKEPGNGTPDCGLHAESPAAGCSAAPAPPSNEVSAGSEFADPADTVSSPAGTGTAIVCEKSPVSGIAGPASRTENPAAGNAPAPVSSPDQPPGRTGFPDPAGATPAPTGTGTGSQTCVWDCISEPEAPVLQPGEDAGRRDQAGPDARIRLFPTREALEACLRAHPVGNALVLVKGSHGIGLEKTLALL